MLRSGHSHEDIDQAFGSLALWLARKARHAATPDDFQTIIQDWARQLDRPHEKERVVVKLDQCRDWLLGCRSAQHLRAHTHTHTRARTHAHRDTRAHATHALPSTLRRYVAHTQTHAHAQTRTHTYMQTHTDIRAQKETRTRVRTNTRRRTTADFSVNRVRWPGTLIATARLFHLLVSAALVLFPSVFSFWLSGNF